MESIFELTVLSSVLTSFISSLVFAFMAPPKAEEAGAEAPADQPIRLLLARAGIHVPPASNDAIGFIFRLGGFSALVAAWLCWQMRKRKRAAQAAM